MKKIVICVILSVLSLTGSVRSQVVQPGKIFIDAGIGLGIQRYQFTYLASGIKNPRDTSGAVEIPLTLEYGIKKWFGAGLLCNFENYINGDTNSNDTYKGFDLVPSVFFHIPWGLQKLDLHAHLGFGYTHFKYDAHNSWGDIYVANGSVLNWGITLRWLWAEDGHFGMNFWFSHAQYEYPHGDFSDNFGNHWAFSLDGPGNNFGLGILLRF